MDLSTTSDLEVRGGVLLSGNDPGTVRHVWVVRGPEGAAHFVYMDWHPDATDELRKIDTKFMIQFGHPLLPLGMDVGYHSPVPMNAAQLEFGPAEEQCDWLDGAPCYVDGSSTRAQEVLTGWLARDRDLDWLFDYLTSYYIAVFRSDGHGPPEFGDYLNVLLHMTAGDDADES